ncbi:MAG: glycosyltransferase family 2 protein [Thermoplasmata archaeon]|nr:glycosyltransferase family 2 protein [Thermoplasmata archaeon]
MSPQTETARSLASGVDPSRFRGAFAVVVLPTLNEEKGLARTLSDLPLDRFHDAGQRVEPLVIDGGSTDGTLEVARAWNIPVLQQTSHGKGGAMLEAIAWVHQQGIPYVVVLDADATYPPDRILPALDLLRGGTDLVVGVRRPVWGPPSDLTDLVHRVGNLVMSYTASVLSRRTILDLCSGFWGVSTQRFMELELDDTSFAIEAELVLKSIRRGLSIQQIPVNYQERIGQAKLRAIHDGGHILLTILQNARPRSHSVGPEPNADPWGRDLLSIGLTLGISGAVVECGPADAVQARDIARFLQRNLPETRVRVGRPVLQSSYGLTDLEGGKSESHPLFAPSPVVVSLPASGSEIGEARSVTVSIRSHRRQLTIQLPSDDTNTRGADSPPGGWGRAGGRMGYALPHRLHFPSLLVVTSRLNFQPERQQQTLLHANGFRVVEQARTKREESGARTLDVVTNTASSTR